MVMIDNEKLSSYDKREKRKTGWQKTVRCSQ